MRIFIYKKKPCEKGEIFDGCDLKIKADPWFKIYDVL
jgi:hypothetical protein